MPNRKDQKNLKDQKREVLEQALLDIDNLLVGEWYTTEDVARIINRLKPTPDSEHGDCGDCKEGVIIHEGFVAACRYCNIFPDDAAAAIAVWELLAKQTKERHQTEEK